MIKLIIIYKK